MNIHSVVVELPEDIYERVDRTAKGLKQPVQQALIKIVEAGCRHWRKCLLSTGQSSKHWKL
jgi:hypothetical protein